MNVFELFATLGIDTSSYDAGLDSAESKGASFGQRLGSVVSTGAKLATAAIGTMTVATVAGTKAFIDGVSDVAQYADAIDKNSQKLGLSIEKYQELDYVLSIAGTSIESTKMGMKTLTNTLDEAQNGSADAIAKFQELGFSLEDIQNMSREDVFENVIYAFQNMEDSVGRAALANDLLGRSSVELAPLLNMTNEETRSLMETANEYGMIMSEDAVQAGANFQDSLTTLQGTLSGLKNNMLSEFLPSFSTIMDGLSAVFAGDDSGLGMIDEGVNQFIESLNETAPKMLEIGASILSSLITAISTNLPTLLQEGSGVLNTLIQGIIKALPSLLKSAMLIISMIGKSLLDNASLLISTALDLIKILGDGLVESLPTLIPAIVSVATEIVSVLTEPDTLSMLINLGLDLILAIADGLVEAIPDLIGVIPEIMANLIVAMQENYPDVLDAVLELLGDLSLALLEGLAALMGTSLGDVASGLEEIGKEITDAFNNIKQWFTDLWDNATEIVSNLWDDVTGFFSDGLENAKETVENVLGNIHDKFDEIFENVKSIVSGAIDFIKGLFDFEWSLPDLKLPHFSVTGSFDVLANPPKLPSVSVEWYAKAMNNPMLLSDATIFGMAGGSLLGGGERGDEMIYGRASLMNDIKQAVAGASAQTIIIPVYIGDEKIDELVVKANKTNDYISGGR